MEQTAVVMIAVAFVGSTSGGDTPQSVVKSCICIVDGSDGGREPRVCLVKKDRCWTTSQSVVCVPTRLTSFWQSQSCSGLTKGHEQRADRHSIRGCLQTPLLCTGT